MTNSIIFVDQLPNGDLLVGYEAGMIAQTRIVESTDSQFYHWEQIRTSPNLMEFVKYDASDLEFSC